MRTNCTAWPPRNVTYDGNLQDLTRLRNGCPDMSRAFGCSEGTYKARLYHGITETPILFWTTLHHTQGKTLKLQF